MYTGRVVNMTIVGNNYHNNGGMRRERRGRKGRREGKGREKV
jgi:hypothetical protein